MSDYLKCWRLYAEFAGRASRREVWRFLGVHLSLILLVCCLAFFALVFETQLVLTIGSRDAVMALTFAIALACVTSYLGASFCPLVAVFVRRMHDIGMSGWWLLVVLVPLFGVIFLAVPLFWHGANRAIPTVEQKLSPGAEKLI